MGPALMRIMEPELREAKKKGMEEGIHGAVNILRALGLSSEEIKRAVRKQYGLTEKETEKYL